VDITSVLSTTIPTVIGAATGIFALYKGLHEYKKGIEQRRQEIEIRTQEMVQKRQERLFPLIKEFDESESMKFAKMILDDLPVFPNRSTNGIPDFRRRAPNEHQSRNSERADDTGDGSDGTLHATKPPPRPPAYL
jgi:hypothetical protein